MSKLEIKSQAANADSKQETARPERAQIMARLCERILRDKKGKDVLFLEVAEKTILADYFVIASASSTPHVRALAAEVEEILSKDYGLEPTHREGLESARWILLDYLDFVVHIFHEEERAFYSIEKLWAHSAARK